MSWKSAMAVLLTAVAGYVDAIGFVWLAQVYVANMSGNTIALGLGWAEGNYWMVAHRGAAIPGFVLGMLLCGVLVRVADRKNIRWMLAALFAFEALLLAAVLSLAAGPPQYEGTAAVVAGALAMGIQNAALTHFGPLNVHTTHVSGTLATMSDELSHGLAGPPHERRPALNRAAWYATVWAAYALAAALGIYLLRKWSLHALTIPIVLLAVIAAIDLRWPLRDTQEAQTLRPTSRS